MKILRFFRELRHRWKSYDAIYKLYTGTELSDNPMGHKWDLPGAIKIMKKSRDQCSEYKLDYAFDHITNQGMTPSFERGHPIANHDKAQYAAMVNHQCKLILEGLMEQYSEKGFSMTEVDNGITIIYAEGAQYRMYNPKWKLCEVYKQEHNTGYTNILRDLAEAALLKEC